MAHDTDTSSGLEFQAVIPMINYENAPAAMDWLMAAFGFRQTLRALDSAGNFEYGELITECGGRVMCGMAPGYQNPLHLSEAYAPARQWLSTPFIVNGVLAYVDDIEAHCIRAEAAGALILSRPEGAPPMRLYRAEDLEGNRWLFVQR